MKIFAPGEELWTSQDRHGCFEMIVLTGMQVKSPPLILSEIDVVRGEQCERFVVKFW